MPVVLGTLTPYYQISKNLQVSMCFLQSLTQKPSHSQPTKRGQEAERPPKRGNRAFRHLDGVESRTAPAPNGGQASDSVV